MAGSVPGILKEEPCSIDSVTVGKGKRSAACIGIGGDHGMWAVPTTGMEERYLTRANSTQVTITVPTALHGLPGLDDDDGLPGNNCRSESKCSFSKRGSEVRKLSKTSDRSDVAKEKHTLTRALSKVSNRDRDEILEAASRQRMQEELSEDGATLSLDNFLVRVKYICGICQLYSLPLTTGVVMALAWSNADADSYHEFTESQIVNGAVLLGHDVSLHFIVNDFFMCFFFGLAVKEVTEALLPGGCLNPLRRAINPIFATVGGILGPIVIYHITVGAMYSAGGFDETNCSEGISSSHRRLGERILDNSTIGGHHGDDAGVCTFAALAKGWGVPTATDISLAWMFSLIIFGRGHPAINFMLLLAILDDAIGMLIIAVFYPDPLHPVEPLWLLLVGAAVAIAFMFRQLNLRSWALYIAICGPVSWLGLIMAHVHPALALAFVVPCMPATRALHVTDGSICNLGACDLGPTEQPAGQSEEEHPSNDSLRKTGQSEEERPRLCSQGKSLCPIEELQPEEEPQSSSTHGRPSREKRPSVTSITSTGSAGSMDSSSSRTSNAVSAMFEAAQSVKSITSKFLGLDEDDAPLHAFEAAMKTPVDFGMFFFGLANAGVPFQAVGNLTGAVLISLCVGKIVGICGFSILATCLGFGLPSGLGWGDMVAMSALAGIGLTVALFLANEAFVQPELRDQAKMGAVLSVGCALIAWPIRKTFGHKEQVAESAPPVTMSAPPVIATPVIEVNVNVSYKFSVTPISPCDCARGA